MSFKDNLQDIVAVVKQAISRIPTRTSQLKNDSGYISDTIYDTRIDLTSANIRSGSWSTTARSRSTNAKRLASTLMYPVKKGDRIVYKTRELLLFLAEYKGLSATRTDLTDFIEAEEPATFTIEEDGYLVFILRNQTNTAVAVEDYDADISIISASLPSTEDTTGDYLRQGYINLDNSQMTEGQWAQKTHQANSARIVNKDLIPVRKGDIVTFETGSLRLHIGEYIGSSTTNTALKDYTTPGEYGSVKITSAGWLTVTLKNETETDITVDDYDAVVRIYNDFESREGTGKSYAYYGEKIQLQGFNSKELLTLDRTHGTPNDIAVYGSYLVSGVANGWLNFYNLNTKALEASLQITEGQHFNCLCFSNTRQASTDPFPLLYAETEGSNGLYLVIRLTSLSSYEVVKQYRFDEATYGSNPAVFFDFENSVAYGICRPSGSDLSKYDWVKFDLTNETENQDGTFTPAELIRSLIPYPKTRQGGQVYRDRLYTMTSNGQTQPKVLVYNPNGVTPQVVTAMPNMPFTIEGEGLAISENEGGLPTFYISSTQKVYRLTF